MFKAIKINPTPALLTAVLCTALTMLLLSTNNTKAAAPVNAEITNSVELPVIMYHGISKVSTLTGDYVITPDEFESDLKYLKNNGYTTILSSELEQFVLSGRPLPDKAIMLTFDDGYYNNYLYAYPLLKEYDFKAIISPIAYYSELYTENGEISECYSHCTWEQISEMHASGYVEIGNHSYNSHIFNDTQHGLDMVSAETERDYIRRVTDELTSAQSTITDNTGITPTVIAYPFGMYNKNTTKVVKSMGFTAAFTCSEGINTITVGDEDALYNLKRLLRPHSKGIETLLAQY